MEAAWAPPADAVTASVTGRAARTPRGRRRAQRACPTSVRWRRMRGTSSASSPASSPASPIRSRTCSPAMPCSQTARHAASNGSTPWASSEPRMPASTSPVPPVAMAGFWNGAISSRPSGAAITVCAPFSTTTQFQRAAAAPRPLGTLGVVVADRTPSRRWNSTGCGVTTSGRRSSVHHASVSASELSASASSTAGTPSAAARRRTRLRVPSPAAGPARPGWRWPCAPAMEPRPPWRPPLRARPPGGPAWWPPGRDRR